MNTDAFIIAAEIVLIAGIICNMIRMWRKNKKQTQLLSLQRDRIREEKLDAMLKNHAGEKHGASGELSDTPYDVNYHEEDTDVYEEGESYISVQAEVKSVLSTRKYVLHVYDHAEIGREEGSRIVLNDSETAEKQIQLIRTQNDLFAKNLSQQIGAELKRGKNTYPLTKEAVRIHSKDMILVGKTAIKLTLL